MRGPLPTMIWAKGCKLSPSTASPQAYELTTRSSSLARSRHSAWIASSLHWLAKFSYNFLAPKSGFRFAISSHSSARARYSSALIGPSRQHYATGGLITLSASSRARKRVQEWEYCQGFSSQSGELMVGNNSPARTTRTPTLLNSAGMILPGRLRPGRDHAGPTLGNGGHLLGHEFAGCPLQRREAPRFAEIRTPSCLPTDHLARRALSHQLSHRQISAEV